MRIPDGYVVAVLDAAGNVVGTIPVGGYNLAKPMGAAQLVQDILGVVESNARARDDEEKR